MGLCLWCEAISLNGCLSSPRAGGELDKTQIPQPIVGADSFPHWTLAQTQGPTSWEVGNGIQMLALEQ